MSRFFRPAFSKVLSSQRFVSLVLAWVGFPSWAPFNVVNVRDYEHENEEFGQEPMF